MFDPLLAAASTVLAQVAVADGIVSCCHCSGAAAEFLVLVLM